ncbi:phytoene desaturase family protein [uncultured Jatrophihabitans sp.]|uniref:phytoene desaturase family protein n=1 Tax=uncultured Jatrophihabitans sp. TaxID=1610747 RepID=UPI0035CA6656
MPEQPRRWVRSNQPAVDVDAVIIGAGHNGLVAANLLADAGQQVLVLEAAPRMGGAVYSDRSLHPDFVTDWYSSFYPLAAASPVLAGLELENWGLQWRHSKTVLAHVLPDGRCAALNRDVDQTAASLDAFAPGDGEAWQQLVREYEAIAEPLINAILRPFPAPRAVTSLLRTLGVADLMRFARFVVSPVRTFARERFNGEGAALLLAGNALHTDLAPEAAGSAVYGWLLCMLGQTVGFPSPVGGSSMIVEALAKRLAASGGEVRTSAEVTSIDVESGRVSAVRLTTGERITTRSVLADVDAPRLFLDLVGPANLPDRLVQDLEGFEWDGPTLKVNWALSSPIPWTATAARDAGTVHFGVNLNDLSQYSTDLVSGRLPEHPFALLGQTTTADPSRSPAGTESAWSYTHIPKDQVFDADQLTGHVERLKDAVEAQAPGFRASILAEQVQTPDDLQSADGNLVHGAVGGGSAAIHQQLFLRPVPGLGRPETVIDGLYLASASAHPGGGVHGAPGGNAAAAALRRSGHLGRVHRGVIDGAYKRIYRP